MDASQPGSFRQGRAQNFIDQEHIDRIVEAYRAFEEVDHFAQRCGPGGDAGQRLQPEHQPVRGHQEAVEVMSVEEALTQLRDAERRRDEAVSKMDALLREMGYVR